MQTGTQSAVRLIKPYRRSYAFTVIELMVSISILAVIVFALYQMFNQTQKALRANVTQVDVLESGRAAMDMMTRELAQLSASYYPGATNFYASLIPTTPPLVQMDLDGKTPLRTNVLQELFFVMPQTNKWTGVGYRVVRADSGVGTLYRFTISTNVHRLSSTNLSAGFVLAELFDPRTRMVSTNFHRVLDGVIHLRVSAYDGAGMPLAYEFPNGNTNVLRQSLQQQSLPSPLTNNIIVRQEIAGQTKVIFLSNAVPSYVDLELGILEPETFEQFKSLRDGSAELAVEFLRKRSTKVHLFRQRIPIRTALNEAAL